MRVVAGAQLLETGEEQVEGIDRAHFPRSLRMRRNMAPPYLRVDSALFNLDSPAIVVFGKILARRIPKMLGQHQAPSL